MLLLVDWLAGFLQIPAIATPRSDTRLATQSQALRSTQGSNWVPPACGRPGSTYLRTLGGMMYCTVRFA